MAGARSWSELRRRVSLAVHSQTTRDGVTRVVLSELLRTPPVVRAGVALTELGGRQLRFCSSDFLNGEERLEAPPWCEIDGMADVPLVHALLTGSPVLLDDLTALRRRYPHLADRQAGLGTRALVALPLTSSSGGPRLGALLVTLGRPVNLRAHETELRGVARVIADALVASAPEAVAPNGRPGPAPDQSAELAYRPAVLRLPSDAGAPRQARAFLRQVLGRWHVDGQTCQDAELCLSEVVTNAVIHAGTPVEVAVLLDGERLVVAVRDGGRPGQAGNPGANGSRRPAPNTSGPGAHETPGAAAHHDASAVGGRGLLLVEHLADRWSYRETQQGTTASFELRLR